MGLYSVLVSKDAFFCIPVHPDSQYLFAFEGKDPKTMTHQQYTWMVLPKKFKDSTYLLSGTLEKHLRELELQKRTILKHVDNILVCNPSKEASDWNTIQTLNLGTGDINSLRKRTKLPDKTKLFKIYPNPRI